VCAIHHEQTTYGPPSAREEQETVRIDVVAYNRKRRMMPSDRRSDKGLPTRSERVSPGPLSRKPSGFLFSSLGRDGHEATILGSGAKRDLEQCRKPQLSWCREQAGLQEGKCICI